eukprot:COSAG06_NODE_316_length_17668_cov_19.142410_2_plen_82_part_00
MVVLVVLVVLVLVLLVLVVLLVVLVVLLLRVGSAVRGGAIAATRCSDVRGWTRPARGNIDRSIANRCHNLAVDSTSPVALL